MSTFRKINRSEAGVVASLVLLMAAYVGCYFAVLSLPPDICLPQWLSVARQKVSPAYVEVSGEWQRYPDYRGLPEWVFGPVHHWDRTYLRPGLWSGRNPRNQELSFEWLREEGVFAAAPTRR